MGASNCTQVRECAMWTRRGVIVVGLASDSASAGQPGPVPDAGLRGKGQ